MTIIFPTYELSEHTIVLEGDQTLSIQLTPLQLIQQAAIKGESDYTSRRKSMTYLTGIKKKIPIPLYPQKNIYAFPTHSPNHQNCHWIFFHQADSIQKLPKSKNSIYATKIIFKNGQELLLTESVQKIEKQMYRTWLCMKLLHCLCLSLGALKYQRSGG